LEKPVSALSGSAIFFYQKAHLFRGLFAKKILILDVIENIEF